MARKIRKRRNPDSYYDKPAHQRIGQRVFDGIISFAALYMLQPVLQNVLAPLQAQINASAAASQTAAGGTPTPPTAGLNSVANTLLSAVAPSGTKLP